MVATTLRIMTFSIPIKKEATLSIMTLSTINGSVVMLSVANKTNMLSAVMLSVKVPLNWIS
jgi:hypothetical protein